MAHKKQRKREERQGGGGSARETEEGRGAPVGGKFTGVRREGSPFASPLVADSTDVPEMRAAIDYVVFAVVFAVVFLSANLRCGLRGTFVRDRHGARRK